MKLSRKQQSIKVTRNWVEQYANPDKEKNEKVKSLLEMGFTEEQAIDALAKYKMEVDAALNFLLNQ